MSCEDKKLKKLDFHLPLITDLHTARHTGSEKQKGEEILELRELLDRGLPFLFTLLLLPICLLSACSAKEAKQQVNLVTLPELAELEASETTIQETVEVQPLVIIEESKEEIAYDSERPEVFLKEYLIASGESTEILEDTEFISALKGKSKEDVIYYAKTLLKILAEGTQAEVAEVANAGDEAGEPVTTNEETGQVNHPGPAEDDTAETYETTPVETNPVETGPVETNIVETTPVETTTEATQAEQANPPQGATAVAQSIINLSNSARAENGLGVLSYDARLESIANIRVQEIVSNFSHTRPDGSDATDMGLNQGLMRTGENIAMYSSPTTGDAIYQGFMNSPGHRANILNSEFTHFAVVAIEVDGMCYVVMYFGRP
ncbi:MAG: CAP domain-containing protein [Eubacteriales bacterium]|nr:CAP domain-containing protein [Eubacteriales bacterium]